MLNVCVVLFYMYAHWPGASGFLTLRHGGKVSAGVSRFECETPFNAELINMRSFTSIPTRVHMGLCLSTDIRFYQYSATTTRFFNYRFMSWAHSFLLRSVSSVFVDSYVVTGHRHIIAVLAI